MSESKVTHRLTLVLERTADSDGWWVARCPEVTGFLTEGRTIGVALFMASDAADWLAGVGLDFDAATKVKEGESCGG